MTPRNVVIQGDALSTLQAFAPASVDVVMTSPPYLAARDYHAGTGELGKERNVTEWVANQRAVAREIHRVLVPTGSFLLNVGDGYSQHPRWGAPRKSLLAGPERLLLALMADGFLVRNRIAWVKTTPMPHPVADRLTNGWEYVFHLVRQADYYYDLDAIRRPLRSRPKPHRSRVTPSEVLGPLAGPRAGLARLAAEGRSGHPLGANPTDVWVLPPGRAVEGHHATFPEALPKRALLATAPRAICTRCNRPWRRSKRRVQYLAGKPQQRPFVPCGCDAPIRPALVVDPFAGSGTTLKVARDLGLDATGIELSGRFAGVARRRAGFEPLEQAA